MIYYKVDIVVKGNGGIVIGKPKKLECREAIAMR